MAIAPKTAPPTHDVKLVNTDGTPIMFTSPDKDGNPVERAYQYKSTAPLPNFRVAFAGFFYDFDHSDPDGSWVFTQREAF